MFYLSTNEVAFRGHITATITSTPSDADVLKPKVLARTIPAKDVVIPT